MSRRVALLALEVGVSVGTILAWWTLSYESTSVYFPPLADIVDRFWVNWVQVRFASDVVPSLGRMATGYVIACIAGIMIGVLLGLSRFAHRISDPLVNFLRSIPSAALLPFAILIFGVGASMKVFIIAFVALWPVLLNATDAVHEHDQVMWQTTEAYGIGRVRRIFQVILPAAGPRIAGGMRTALSLALTVMIISEMVASTNGIGYFTLQAQRSFAITDMWSGIILLGLLGYLLNLIFTIVERRVLSWYYESKAVAQ